jgi:uncharacterized repeat protein (TIGR01451 family)
VKFPDLLLLFVAYTLVVAGALGTYIYFSLRGPRPKRCGLAIPNVTGMNVKRAEGNIVAWPPAELVIPLQTSEPAAQGPEPLNVSPPGEARPSVPAGRRTETLEGSALAVTGDPGAAGAAPLANVLAEVFGPRDPLLPEGLRTLEVLPNRIVQAGTTVRAAFTFRNLGGGSASGFRVRFRLPQGLTYIAGTARIDDTPLGDQNAVTALLEARGADIGEIPAGGERRVSLAFTVVTTIENGSPLTLQAAVASPEVPVIGSNVVRLIVKSLPVLENPQTTLLLGAIRETLPGEELQFNARIHNSGQSSAHDLVVLLPLPANTTLVPNSVTIDGRPPAPATESPTLGFARPTVVAPQLEPGATIDIGYRMRIDTPLEDATQITATGAVCSQEVAEFSLPPVSIEIPSAPSFAGDDTSFRVECEDQVEPGESVRIVLYAKNVGTASARKLSLRIALPDGMLYTAGSLAIDGAPTPDRGAMPDAIRLGDVEPGRSVELALSAIVHAPIADGHVTARSAQRFPTTFNKIERETPRRVGPGDLIAFTIALLNMGTDVASGARLQLVADEGIERLRVLDRDAEIAIAPDGTIGLDPLEPGVSRSLRVEAQVRPTIEDHEPLTIAARVTGLNVVPFGLTPIELATHAEASFSDATLSAEPPKTVDAGAQIVYTLVLPNNGDGVAKLVTARVLALSNAVYAQGSTTVNGIALQDRAGTSLLFGEEGLRLADVGAGVEVVACWRAIVNTPLPPSATIETTVGVRWDDVPAISISTAPIAVCSTSALPIIEPELPFSVLGAVAAPAKALPAARTETGTLQPGYPALRPALPVRWRIPTVRGGSESISSIGPAQPVGQPPAESGSETPE